MAKIELLTFGEAARALDISSGDMNDLIMSGKIAPVRHQGRLKFKKADIDTLKDLLPRKPKPSGEVLAGQAAILPLTSKPAIPSMQPKSAPISEYCSQNQAISQFQLLQTQLDSWIQSGRLQVFEGKDGLKFLRAELEKCASLQLQQAIPEEEHSLKLDIPTAAASELPTANGDGPAYDSRLPFPEPHKVQEDEYCSMDHALSVLQMEKKILDRMIDDGELEAVTIQGKLKLKKTEVEMLRQERMLNATLCIEQNKLVEEDDEMRPIVISANSELSIPVVDMPPQEEFLSFDEAVYELQIEAGELKRMIARQEIEAIKRNDGQLQFRKADIQERCKKIEPTLILPDDAENKEDTVAVPVGKSLESSSDAQFCTFAQAAQLLKVSEKEIQDRANAGLLKVYRQDGIKKVKRSDLSKRTDTKSPKSSAAIPDDDFMPLPTSRSRESQAKQPPVASKPPGTLPEQAAQYYTMEEVQKLLNKEEKDVKILVAKGQLQIIRSGKSYLFAKETIDTLVSPKLESATATPQNNSKGAPASSPAKRSPFLDEEEYTPLPSTTKKDADKVKSSRPLEATMMLPLQGKGDVQEEDEQIAFIPLPKNVGEKPKVAPAKPVPPPITRPPEVKANPAVTEADLRKNYFTWQDALSALQLDDHDLREVVQRGMLQIQVINNQKWIKKLDVEALKKGKMIEPTMVFQDDDEKDILADDDEDTFKF